MSDTEKFSEEEARRRFEAAIKGARIAGHRPMQTVTKKKPNAKTTKSRRAKKK